MVDIAVILGADKDRAMKELRESLAFEMKLANVRTTFYRVFYHSILFTVAQNLPNMIHG